MIKGIVCIGMAAVLAQPAVTYAGSSCGGGGGGGGSSGGGGGSSGGGSSSSSSGGDGGSAAEACVDSTDVVGYRRCTKYGTWAKNLKVPRFFLELGSNVRQFGSSLHGQSATAVHGSESFAFRTVMAPAQQLTDTAVTTTLRLGFGLPRGLYLGGEFEVGGLVSQAAATAEMSASGTFGTPTVSQETGLVLGAVGVAGVRVARGRGSIALEGAGGVRTVRYSFASSYHNCEDRTSIVANRGVVEARARGELWLNPWLTAGGTIGSNVLSQGDWMAGLYFGLHSRAFGGGR